MGLFRDITKAIEKVAKVATTAQTAGVRAIGRGVTGQSFKDFRVVKSKGNIGKELKNAATGAVVVGLTVGTGGAALPGIKGVAATSGLVAGASKVVGSAGKFNSAVDTVRGINSKIPFAVTSAGNKVQTTPLARKSGVGASDEFLDNNSNLLWIALAVGLGLVITRK